MRVRGWPACRVITPVVYAAAIVTAAAGAPVAQETVVGGPSGLLSYLYGASPYSGVGRYEGRATCTAFFLETAPVGDAAVAAPAYAITSGHCPASSGANDVLIRPWAVGQSPAPFSEDLIKVVGAPLWPVLTKSFLRAARCRTDGVAPIVLEHVWHWFDSPFNRCRDILPGSAGSPVISVAGRVVVGIVNTTTIGAASMSECALGHPREPVNGNAVGRRETTYVTTLAGLGACFDVTRRFNIREPGCPLDRGTQPDADPPIDDCRTTPAYSVPISASASPLIDSPLPSFERFAFLCILGASSPAGDIAAGGRAHPTIVVARPDRIAPRLPVQVTITETDAAWRVRFTTVGDEVAFHAYKAGRPVETRCSDPQGYRFAAATLVELPRADGPYRLCVIPYDAAQNPGAIFERELS